MCSHLALVRKQARALARELSADVPDDFEEIYRPSERIGPADPHWLLRGSGDLGQAGQAGDKATRRLFPAALGLAIKGKKSLLLNARSETVHRLPAFRDAFVRRRCLIPADAFFEWTGEKAARQPVRFVRRDGGLLLLCALYEEAIDPQTGEVRMAYVILTTRPNEVVGRVHDRMPVILSLSHADQVDVWLAPTGSSMNARELLSLMAPAPDDALVSEERQVLKSDEPVPSLPLFEKSLPTVDHVEKSPSVAEEKRRAPMQLNLFD